MALIMVVDDDPDIRDLAAFALQADGHDVTTHHDAPAALTALHHRQPDIIITDFHMPAMTGAELAQRTRRAQPTAHIPIIMISGGVQPAQIDDGTVDVLLAKPFSPRRLREHVALLLPG